MLRDRHRLQRRLSNAAKQKKDAARQAMMTGIEKEIVAAGQIVMQRQAAVPEITFPAALPVSQKKQQIADAIRDHQVVIVAGETGSGKTTQLPKICMQLGRGIRGIIGHTQPRRLAARTVAHRIADELATLPGECVGYKVRFTDQVNALTQVKLMTDGVLLAEIQQDRLLLQYDTIIIDEAHERSLNIDFLLGYLRELLPRRPDLKIIITSATIDPERFSRHFHHAPVIEVSGRTYPVEVRYRPAEEQSADGEEDWMQPVVAAIDELYLEKPGDILIFMSGEREIRDAAEALNKRNLPHTEVLPLYARLSNAEQNRVFQPHTGRRIVLATNVAETSLTVPGIRYVIDPGMARISRYSYRTKVQRLPVEPVSQASASQRKGRCGRVSEGICIRLYSEQDFQQRPAFTEPEIMRTNLASVILQLTALDLGDITTFPFVDAPDKRRIQDGVRLLEELGAVSRQEGGRNKLTTIGRQLAQLPIDPRLARMVLAAQQYGCVHEMMIITAALSIQDPRERPADRQQAADEKHRRFTDKDSDFITYVNLWHFLKEQQHALSSGQFRRQCKNDYLNPLRIREWQDMEMQLRQIVHDMGLRINSEPAKYREIHLALLSGLLSHLGQKDSDKHEFTGARNIKFAIFPASGLFKKPPKWVMVAELVETRRLWGRTAARIEADWIEPLAPHLVKRSYSEPHWSKKRGAVIAREKVMLYGLAVVTARKVDYGNIDPVLSRELFIRHALVEGEWQTPHAFFLHNQHLRSEVEALEHKSRRRDILVDDETLFQFYHQRLGKEVVSAAHFDSWWREVSRETPDLLFYSKEMLINAAPVDISTLNYPDCWQQGNLKLPLSYQFEPGSEADGVTVHIPLALLNQVDAAGFEWQIPALRRELVIALIKSLPKSLRRHFVPAPDYADAFLNRVTPLALPLLLSLQQECQLMTGVNIDQESWQWEQVPDYLKITFRVWEEDPEGYQESKSLNLLQSRLQQKAQETLVKVADDGLERSGLKEWNFGDLPAFYERKHGEYSIRAWPALADEQQSVAIRLFDSQQEQQVVMWRGLRRLLLLNIPSPIRYLHKTLPDKARLGLCFNPSGSVQDLIDDCIACAVDKLIAESGGPCWRQGEYHKLHEKVRAELNDTVVNIAGKAEQILTVANKINIRLKGRVELTQALALADMKKQMGQLIYRGFVSGNGWNSLSDTLRYLHAIERRLDKLPGDQHSDRARMLKIEQVQQAWQSWLQKLPVSAENHPEVKAIRWMIEELRVSYFAQQLGTPFPVSEKRILQAMAKAAEAL